MTYGKAARGANAWGSMTADDQDDELSYGHATTVAREQSVKQTYPVAKSGSEAHLLGKAKIKRDDVWDVPSSDDERAVTSSRTTAQRPKSMRKPAVTEEVPQLASWEKKNDTSHVSARTDDTKATIRGAPSPRAVKRTSITVEARELESHAPKATSRNIDVARGARSTTVNETAANPLSAAARLQAKKNVGGKSLVVKDGKNAVPAEKRTSDDLKSDELPTRSRKRLRAAPQQEQQESRPASTSEANEEGSDDAVAMNLDTHMDIDVLHPEPDAKVDNNRRPGCGTAPIVRGEEAGQPTKSTRRYQKQVSAPSRLHGMVSSLQNNSIATAPMEADEVKIISNGPSSHVDGVEEVIQNDNTTTPRPARRWNRRLPEETAISSPSDLPMASLLLQSTKRPTAASPAITLGKSKSDIGQRRPKLVDRLKALAQSSDEEDETDTSFTRYKSANALLSPTKASSPPQSQQSQTLQSQPTQIGRAGPPKITYAKSRSHLDDTADNNLLLDMIAPPSHSGAGHKTNIGHSVRTPQKSSWDLDEDDASGPKTQQFRSIHELRANGDNMRFLHDIGNLMDDISDQKYSARSRRRSALMELALRLADKAFAQKFCRGGHEQKLIVECSSAPDEIADFSLAAAFMILTVDDGPDNIFVVFRDGGVLEWLKRQLGVRRPVENMIKDRRNNMAKSTQSTWLAESVRISAQDAVWGDNKPTTITLRLVALKAIENIIRRLRRNGDTSDLIGSVALPDVVPQLEVIQTMTHDQSNLFEVVHVISVLEASTLPSTASSWTSELVERIISILVSPALSEQKSQHTYFLTIRLCHNLINDNIPNRTLFCSHPAVLTHLLSTVETGLQKQHAASGAASSQFSDEASAASALDLDVLVLAFGLIIVMTEHDTAADQVCASAAAPANLPTLTSLAQMFRRGRTLADEALTEEAVVANVAHGYLAVVLANLCRDPDAREVIVAQLSSSGRDESEVNDGAADKSDTGGSGGLGGLATLVAAVEEFVMYHQKVDMVNLDADMGESAFTEVLKGVLKKLKENVDD
jgi:hypothetical protein